MQIPTHYVTIANFGDLGIGHKCDPSTFDDACDAYAEAREEGHDAAVFRVDPHADGKAGMMVDVTDDAEARICQWLNDRRQELPAWMEVA